MRVPVLVLDVLDFLFAHPEVVPDFVDERLADRHDEVVFIFGFALVRTLEDEDAVGQRVALRPLAFRERNARVEPEQRIVRTGVHLVQQLVFGLVLAVARSLPGPVLFPVRLLATVYVDAFRALPSVLVIYILGFGIPGLGIAGIPVDPFFYAVVALTLVYSAYVSEVYRAGIDSVHPSQDAAARSLGLSRLQSLRYVVVPQAVRRVVPPLLNDFVGLQKDTALVAFVVAIPEAFKQAQIYQSADFNFTPLLGAAVMFLLVTVPLTRTVDWMLGRERRRRQAGSAL